MIKDHYFSKLARNDPLHDPVAFHGLCRIPPPPDLWTTHPLSSGLPLFLIPELRAVSGNLRQPEVKCFAYK